MSEQKPEFYTLLLDEGFIRDQLVKKRVGNLLKFQESVPQWR